MIPTVQLTGITWDHSRALPPLVAAAQRYEETHCGIRIHWQKRTLDEFGHMPIDVLAQKFDLIIIDHPWAGFCFEKNLTLDLAQVIPAADLAELKHSSIGLTFESYVWQNKILALPIDAATPAPSWRPDLLARAAVQPPQTWAEAVALAQRQLAVIPGFPADLFLHFLMLVKALGADFCTMTDEIAPRETMTLAAEMLRELTEPMPRDIFELNPILVAERMTTTDDFAWNAFAYTYNNYARPDFAPKPLRFGNLLSLEPGGSRLRSVLGGTGIAISANCKNITPAIDYARFVASSIVQKGIYVHAGGQPSQRAAWNDSLADELGGGFFRDTRTTQSEAILRPRYSGYVALQMDGGKTLQEYLRDGRSLPAVLDKLDALYRESRARGGQNFQTN